MTEPVQKSTPAQDFDWLDFDQDAAGDDEEEFDCHMGPDGQCGGAGSEMCDFECPTMAALRARWRKEDRVNER